MVISGQDPDSLTGGEPSTSAIPLGRPRSLPIAPIVVGAVLIAFGLIAWIGYRAEGSMRQAHRQSLHAIVSANVSLLQTWLDQRRQDGMGAVEETGAGDAAMELLQTRSAQLGPQRDSIQADRARAELARQLKPIENDRQYVGWALLSIDGQVVASSHAELTGQRLPIASDSLEKITTRSATVCRPLRCPIAFAREGPHSRSGAAVMCAMAPIVRGGRTEGSLALLLDPLDRFSEILSVTWMGDTGESYAFDRNGVLLSRSRFEQPLRAAGMLAPDLAIASPLNIAIRQPGVDISSGQFNSLTSSPSAGAARDERPLTWMADQATRGSQGENVAGYDGYRGTEVIGAWQWLPEYGIGIATEIEANEAYSAMRLLNRAYFAALGLALVSMVGVWILVSARRRLSGRAVLAGRSDRRLGQYHLNELIGRGGMGSVYRGTHGVLKREVAVKVLEGDEVNSQSVARFEREVRLTARLRHPNTIAIYDYGRTDDDTFYYVMEYVDGITIQQLVAEFGRQPPQRVIYLLLQICGSLSEAHEMGLVHRDIKPANLLVTARAGLYDMVKVLDFGLVKQIERETLELTQTDGITGTPMYMSPESVRDASTVDERSDLYSIGAVGYMMLTGLPPFDGDATVDICLKQLNEDPIRPSARISSPLPEDLQNILMNSLRKDPDQRPRSVQDFAESLGQCRDAHGWTAADAYRWWGAAFAIKVDSPSSDPDDVAEFTMDDPLDDPLEDPRDDASRTHDQDTARQ
jgi:serine/threonine protein kinase